MSSELRDKAMALRRAMFEAREERDRALKAIERVRELHRRSGEWCEECSVGYPCATVSALDGSP